MIDNLDNIHEEPISFDSPELYSMLIFHESSTGINFGLGVVSKTLCQVTLQANILQAN